MINRQMREDFISLGLKKDDVVLMHSSLSSLGYVEGGADTIIDTLLDVLAEGTLLIPSLTYSIVTEENPKFIQGETPTCIGKISNVFLKREGVIRSLHPTHSVCGIGKYAEEILSQHILTDTPAGALSPFGLLPKYNGKILMLGCGLEPNTSMHAIEEVTQPWYLLKSQPTVFTLVDYEKNAVQKSYKCHDFEKVARQRYDRLEVLMPVDKGNVLQATAYLIDAKKMWEVAVPKLEEDEIFFVDLKE